MKENISIFTALTFIFLLNITGNNLSYAAKNEAGDDVKVKSRWEIDGKYAIRWDIKDDIPHYDHIEMSGEQITDLFIEKLLSSFTL